MGTFAGHAIPGSAFVLWGSWWYGNTMLQIMRSQGPTAQQREESLGALPASAGQWKVHTFFTPLEPAAKLTVPLIAAVGELWWASWALVDSSITNYQHATMYLGFVLAGIVDLLEWKGRLPPASGHVALVGALVLEALLFLGHPNPPGLDRTVHHLLVYTILLGAVMLLLELRYRSAFFSLGKAFALILQGTWFWQISYLLFRGDYDPTSHPNMMKAQMFFVWHVLAISLVMFAVYQVVRLVVRPQRL